MKQHYLKEITWPDFGSEKLPPQFPFAEYQSRIQACQELLKKHNYTHLIIYADREHFANLTYLTGFDPRFEESLMIIRASEKPLILIGNECFAYVDASPLCQNNQLRKELYQSFSLLNQPRTKSRKLIDILKDEKIVSNSCIGCVGTKYFDNQESADPQHAIDIPAYITDILRNLAGFANVINASDLFLHPEYGLRTTLGIYDIAYMEYTNCLASEGVKDMLFAIKEGITDFELVKKVGYNGTPLGCHLTFLTDANQQYGLCSPEGAVIKKGSVFATNFCYWGANICRAGWIANNENDLPASAKGYTKEFAGKYFEVMNEWFKKMRPGNIGGEIYDYIHKNLPFEVFGITLNPGHLIHLDEWTSSPIDKNSQIKLRSGMVFQVDIIPCSEKYFSTRMEDGIVIADANLQKKLKETFPEVLKRCLARRDFMNKELGFELPEEVLPLSNMTGIVNPFFLNPNLVFALK